MYITGVRQRMIWIKERKIKMIRKRQLRMGLCFLIALAVCIIGEQAATGAEKIVLRLSHANQVTHIRHKSAVKWKELLEKESKGRVEVKIFPSSQLYKSTEEIPALLTGGLDVAVTHGGPIGALVPEWELFIAPFLWPNDGFNFEASTKFIGSDVVRRLMVSKAEEKGLKLCGFVTAVGGGGEFSTTKRQVRKIDDFKGLKMNTMGGWLRFAAVKALGASCVTMPKSEVGQALAQGTLDGEFSTVSDALTSGYPVNYIHWWPSWGNDTGAGFWMSMKKFNSLPDDIKKLITDVVTPETQKYALREVVALEQQSIVELKKRGKIFVNPDPGTLEECARRTEYVLNMYGEKFGKDGQELVRVAKEMVRK